MSKASEAAEAFYFGLLRRELEARGQGDAAPHLREHILMVPSEEVPLVANEDPNKVPIRFRCKLAHRLTEMTVRLHAETGERISWYIDFLALEGDKTMPEADALKLAEQVAEPPKEAKLESSGYETVGPRTIYRARWVHFEQDMRVEGDFIEVLINGKNKQVFSYTKMWRTPKVGSKS